MKASIVYFKKINGRVVRDADQMWPVQVIEQSKGKIRFVEQDVDFVDGKCVIVKTSDLVKTAEYHKGSWIVSVPRQKGNGTVKLFGVEIEIGRACFMHSDSEIVGSENAGKFFDF